MFVLSHPSLRTARGGGDSRFVYISLRAFSYTTRDFQTSTVVSSLHKSGCSARPHALTAPHIGHDQSRAMWPAVVSGLAYISWGCPQPRDAGPEGDIRVVCDHSDACSRSPLAASPLPRMISCTLAPPGRAHLNHTKADTETADADAVDAADVIDGAAEDTARRRRRRRNRCRRLPPWIFLPSPVAATAADAAVADAAAAAAAGTSGPHKPLEVSAR